MYGGNGNDTIVGGSSIWGGEGNNTIEDNGKNTLKMNVPGENAMFAALGANETREILINGIKYKVTNTKNADNTLVYSMVGDTIKFTSGAGIIVEGDKNSSHKVDIAASNMTYKSGDQNDIIKISAANITVFAGGGDDDITVDGYFATVYGERGTRLQAS